MRPTLPIEGFSGSDHSIAYDINDFGDIAGAANTATGLRAFRSRRNTAYIELAPLSGDTSSAAFGINLSGNVVGYSSGPNGTRGGHLEPGGIVGPLPALSGANGSRALAINDEEMSLEFPKCRRGRVQRSGRPRGTAQDLGTLPGHGVSEALSIMRAAMSSDLLGIYNNAAPCSGLKAAPSEIWGPFQAALRAGARHQQGEVVGTSETSDGEHAFLWTEAGGMQDLNSLLTSRSGFVLTQAVSINSRGSSWQSVKTTTLTPRSLSGSSCLSQHLKQIYVAFST